ncbi:Conserved membrane protein YqhR [Paenibacillus sp. yr247]|uniref:YqhR family membrane protein n=1 Tax=Paenibacillus sp. yr247 TaxID=1761880 RepID=UPI0008816166|nr:YqhR family membrane protein [Paenibacillus sp. yr247]SDO09702.1 Conserved membrane protein YqhR [Paenibacillus sp. yr247]
MIKEKNEGKLKTNRWLFVLYIGFFAGFIWGAFKIVEQYLKFTKIVIGFLVEPFFKHDFLLTWQGTLIGWGFFTLFSIVAAFIYMVFMWKLQGPWWGLGYGAFWWAAIYLFIGPLAGMTYWINNLDVDTIISDFCLFLLWGMFIGYSISIEYTNIRTRQPIHKT